MLSCVVCVAKTQYIVVFAVDDGGYFFTKTAKTAKKKEGKLPPTRYFCYEALIFKSKWIKVANQSETFTREKSTRSQLVKR